MNEQVLNVKFVKLVHKHPCLYNYNIPQHSRKDITEKAWNEIATEMGMTVAACKEKWRNVRSVFNRHIKNSTPSGSVRRMKPYYLYDTLQFLIPFTNVSALLPSEISPEPFHELKHEEDATESSSEQTEITPKENEITGQGLSDTTAPLNCPKQKSKMNDVDNILKCYIHRKVCALDKTSTDGGRKAEAIKMFLLSLVPELEELSDTQIKIFKRRVLHLIDDISSNHGTTPSIHLPRAQVGSSLQS